MKLLFKLSIIFFCINTYQHALSMEFKPTKGTEKKIKTPYIVISSIKNNSNNPVILSTNDKTLEIEPKKEIKDISTYFLKERKGYLKK